MGRNAPILRKGMAFLTGLLDQSMLTDKAQYLWRVFSKQRQKPGGEQLKRYGELECESHADSENAFLETNDDEIEAGEAGAFG